MAGIVLDGCQIHAGFRLGRYGIKADFVTGQIPDARGLAIRPQFFIESVCAQRCAIFRFQDQLAKGPPVSGQLQIC